jgi:aminopeptidase YwaD
MTEIIEVVKEELSGSKAKSYVAGLTGHHRIQGSPMMREAAEHVRTELERIGIDEVAIEGYPADGKKRYWTHTSVMGWSVRGAELRLVDPHDRLLARFSDLPQSLHTYSRGTPKGGITAELVDVGKGVSDKDYVGKGVKGKLVLATGSAKRVQNEAVVKRGAAGVVTDSLSYEFPGVRESTDIPDAHSYQGIWPNARNAKKVRFGFSLSRRQGNELRRLLDGGKKVKLHAEVDAELSPGEYSIVSASITGSTHPEQEVFLVAHLCHPRPSANDNASGSGLLIEVARTITALIRSGRIEKPKRTIRFLWVPETTGTVAFLSENEELHRRLVAGINLDMVGEDQELCRSTLCMTCTPDSLPSFINDLVYSMIERANAACDSMARLGMDGTFRYARTPFSDGSDHAEFNAAAVGAPCVALTQWPDMFYHTSMDTLDKVSEDSLRRVGVAVAASLLVMANADQATAHWLSCMTASAGMRRISDAVGVATDEILHADRKSARVHELVDHHVKRLNHIVVREEQAVRSVARLDKRAAEDESVERQAEAVRDHGLREQARLVGIVDAYADGRSRAKRGGKGHSGTDVEGAKSVPKRRFKGTIDPDLILAELGEGRYSWYREMEDKDRQFSARLFEIVNLIDGKRSVLDIAEFVSAEFGQTRLCDVLKIVEDLERMRLVST